MTSLKRNVAANYVGQLYVTLIGIVMVPIYLRYMGVESYGLIGVFTMLQAWFMLLDIGLTPTMARETARYVGGAIDGQDLRSLLRTLEWIFILVGSLVGIAMIARSELIATRWLKVQHLPLGQVQTSICLMGILVALRWISGLYRGVINGFENLVWLSVFNIAIATARFGFVVPFFIYFGASPIKFFAYQLFIALAEVLLLLAKTYGLLPKIVDKGIASWQSGSLRAVLRFALTIAFTGSLWVLVTQTDKLLLSKLLPLTDYAYFSTAVLAANGVMVISGPISFALLPRLTRLNAKGDNVEFIRVYRAATQLVCVVAIPATLVLAFFAENILWSWTGSPELSRKAAPVLVLYALGNGILALSGFPYYLQYAKGDLKLHLVGSGLFVAVLLPAVIWGTRQYGVVGAGCAWLVTNIAYFFLWVPIVHREFLKGLHARWLFQDIGRPVLLTVLAAVLVHSLIRLPEDRPSIAILVALVGLGLLSIAAAGSSSMRESVKAVWHSRFAQRAAG